MVKVQLLLHQKWRNPEGIEAAKAALSATGMQPTVSGATTISAELDASRFEDMFGMPPPDAESKTLGVPPALQQWIQSISVAPPHIYLQN